MEAIQVVFEELRKKGTKGLSHYLTVIYSQTCFHRRVFPRPQGTWNGWTKTSLGV